MLIAHMAYELRNTTAAAVSECTELSYIRPTVVSVLQTAATN